MQSIQSYRATQFDSFPTLAGTARPALLPHPAFSDSREPAQNAVLAQLTSRDLSELKSRFQMVEFERGETVYPADHVIDSVYFPLSAVASRLSILEDGSTVEVGLIGHDGVIGLAAL